ARDSPRRWTTGYSPTRSREPTARDKADAAARDKRYREFPPSTSRFRESLRREAGYVPEPDRRRMLHAPASKRRSDQTSTHSTELPRQELHPRLCTSASRWATGVGSRLPFPPVVAPCAPQLVHLQRTYGNQAALRMLRPQSTQPKPAITE